LSNRLRSRLIWRTAKQPNSAKSLDTNGASEAQVENVGFTVGLAPRELAIRLLWIGAEVEHALMVQYLYAAYSLNAAQPDEGNRLSVQRWQRTVLEIAREEMGHLATVENLLTLIGGTLHFDREDFPIEDPDLWPFPFQLEPLTKLSLGKYVLAETPSEEVLISLKLKEEVDEIRKKLDVEGDSTVHRVGRIYDEINSLFDPAPMPEGPDVPPFTDTHPSIATIDIQAESIGYQVTPSAWGLGMGDLLIKTSQDRKSAQKAIQFISEQGEGTKVPADLSSSHFGKFLDIYRQFPDKDEWQPSHRVATNPTTNPKTNDPLTRIEGDAASWAQLCNLRYHMLLLYLHHSFLVEAPAGSPTRSPRGSLISWTFGEMYHIKSISQVLMNMPLQPNAKINAGPPFEMPYTLSLSVRDADRWRAHRDLLWASITLTGKMLKTPSTSEPYLHALLTSDQTTLEQLTALIGA
jgi:Ferritin-like